MFDFFQELFIPKNKFYVNRFENEPSTPVHPGSSAAADADTLLCYTSCYSGREVQQTGTRRED